MPSPSANTIIESLNSPACAPNIGAHPEYDASLLFCRMARLRIDRERLAIDDPLLFRELQGRCTLCVSKQVCIRELSSHLSATWTDYCPNAGPLSLLESVECCSGLRPNPSAPA
jgi:hypothetical protein